MTDDTCTATKNDGSSCDNPAKYADGKCGIHSDINGDTQGRPTKFTDERARIAIEAARGEDGKSIRGCERAAGVGEGTIDGWLEQGHTFENADGLIDSFSRAFAQARGDGESYYITEGGRTDGDIDPSFAKFMLASSYDYKKTEQREVTGEGGGAVSIEFTEEVVQTQWSEGEE